MKHGLVIAAVFREMAPNLYARAVQAGNAELRQETCAVFERVRRPGRRGVALVAVEAVDREGHVAGRRARRAGAVVATLAVRDAGVIHLRRCPGQG